MDNLERELRNCAFIKMRTYCDGQCDYCSVSSVVPLGRAESEKESDAEWVVPKLKPCPFCGSTADLKWEEDPYLMWVECNNCEARMVNGNE